MEGISGRLASLDGLYFPGAMHREISDSAQRKSALLDLLSRDASIFLGMLIHHIALLFLSLLFCAGDP